MNKLTLCLLSVFTLGSFTACGPIDDTLQVANSGVESEQNTPTQTPQAGPPPGGQRPGGAGPGGQPPQLDLTQAAKTLGVSVEALTEALNITPGQAPDFAAAAKKLGVTEEVLRAAVPAPPQRPAAPPQN